MNILTNGPGRKPRTVFRIGKFHADRDSFSDAIWNWRWDQRLIVSITAYHLMFYRHDGRRVVIGKFGRRIGVTVL